MRSLLVKMALVLLLAVTVQAQDAKDELLTFGRRLGEAERQVMELDPDVLKKLGVTQPKGASIKYDPKTARLDVVNTRENLKRLQQIFDVVNSPAIQSRVDLTIVRVSAETAAAWGMDGLPPSKPETSPFKGPVPTSMTPEQSQRFFTELRRTPGFQIVTHMSTTSASGGTTNIRNTIEQQLPDDYTVPRLISAQDHDDDDVDDELEEDVEEVGDGPVIIVGALPNYSGGQKHGSQLTTTATVEEGRATIDLALTPTYSEIVGWTIDRTEVGGKIEDLWLPMVQQISMEVQVAIDDGHTMIIGAANQKAEAPQKPTAAGTARHTHTMIDDARPIYFILTAHIKKPSAWTLESLRSSLAASNRNGLEQDQAIVDEDDDDPKYQF